MNPTPISKVLPGFPAAFAERGQSKFLVLKCPQRLENDFSEEVAHATNVMFPFKNVRIHEHSKRVRATPPSDQRSLLHCKLHEAAVLVARLFTYFHSLASRLPANSNACSRRVIFGGSRALSRATRQHPRRSYKSDANTLMLWRVFPFTGAPKGFHL